MAFPLQTPGRKLLSALYSAVAEEYVMRVTLSQFTVMSRLVVNKFIFMKYIAFDPNLMKQKESG